MLPPSLSPPTIYEKPPSRVQSGGGLGVSGRLAASAALSAAVGQGGVRAAVYAGS